MLTLSAGPTLLATVMLDNKIIKSIPVSFHYGNDGNLCNLYIAKYTVHCWSLFRSKARHDWLWKTVYSANAVCQLLSALVKPKVGDGDEAQIGSCKGTLRSTSGVLEGVKNVQILVYIKSIIFNGQFVNVQLQLREVVSANVAEIRFASIVWGINLYKSCCNTVTVCCLIVLPLPSLGHLGTFCFYLFDWPSSGCWQ